jgi:hypothetical protein
MTLEEGLKKIKKHIELKNENKWKLFQQQKKRYSNQHLEIEPQIE